jgi:hypothetical protein
MLGVNLICVAVLGLLATLTVRKHGAGGLPAWAFMLWPGFLTSLTHDTTELLACACLLGAALAWLQGRLTIFIVLAACAALTRETSSLMLAGLVLAGLANKAVVRKTSVMPALCAAVALAPVLLWHFWLVHVLRGVAEAAPPQTNIGLPFAGVAQRLAAALGDAAGASGLSGAARFRAAYAAATALGIIAFSGWVTACLPALLRRGGREAAIGIGWLCMMALICMLTARGPWIDPTAIFRAFSECWVVGWLILVLSGARAPRGGGLALLPFAVINWQLCLVQLR